MFVSDPTFPRKIEEGVARARAAQLAKARTGISELVNQTAFAKERIILTRYGKPLVALVPIEDLQLLEALEDRMDLADARAALEESKRKGTKPLRALIKELGRNP